jgi:hypothetical protein
MPELPMAETAFDDALRITVLTALKAALVDDVSSTTWAYLWLSDIDKLEEILEEAQRRPVFAKSFLVVAERYANVIQKCGLINFYTIS